MCEAVFHVSDHDLDEAMKKMDRSIRSEVDLGDDGIFSPTFRKNLQYFDKTTRDAIVEELPNVKEVEAPRHQRESPKLLPQNN